MRAFTDTVYTKEQTRGIIERHIAQDQLIQRIYGEFDDGQFRGCFIGCTVHEYLETNNVDMSEVILHSYYPTLYGVEQEVARILDIIYENMEGEEIQWWFQEGLLCIPTGATVADTRQVFKSLYIKHLEKIQSLLNEYNQGETDGLRGSEDYVYKLATGKFCDVLNLVLKVYHGDNSAIGIEELQNVLDKNDSKLDMSNINYLKYILAKETMTKDDTESLANLLSGLFEAIRIITCFERQYDVYIDLAKLWVDEWHKV